MTSSLNLFWIMVTFATAAKASVTSIDFCNDAETKCNGYEHIGCNNTGAFLTCCRPDATVIEMDLPRMAHILKAHNTLRNEFAAGVEGFLPAARLGVVQWNANLATLAELHVKQCDLSPDSCRNTMDYMYVGQNSAESEWSPDEQNYTVDAVTQRHIESWYSQKRLITMSQLQSYPMEQPPKTFGHFTVLINQKSAFIGCAVMRQTESSGNIRQLTTCNYSHDNVVGKPTYITGKTGSQCKAGLDPVYKNLCSPLEVYEVNQL